MKEDEINKLIEKYKEGESTLDEEQFLLDHVDESEPSLKLWSTYVNNTKIQVPEHFNDSLWKSFEKRKAKKRKVFVAGIMAAASILLLISLLLTKSTNKELDYAEKEALLHQALMMVSDSDTHETQQNIIYENEMIIIYTTTE